jgi:Mn-dependent DtxR family transcriptional regulator
MLVWQIKIGRLVVSSEITHSVAHYLLTIHRLKEVKGYARVTDVARELDITKGSVSTAMNSLKKRGLIKEEEGAKFILLTEQGHKIVHRILSSRILLYYFLKDVLGVSEKIAFHESCEMEHLLSTMTQEKLFYFLQDLIKGDKKRLGVICSKIDTDLELMGYESFEQFVQQQDAVLPFEE